MLRSDAAAASVSMPHVDVDPFGAAFLTDPYAHHAALRDVGPVFRIDTYGIFGMARYAEVAAALKDWRRFSSARGVGLDDFAVDPPIRPPSMLLEADPPLHTRARTLMTPLLSAPVLSVHMVAWQRKAGELVDRLVEARRFDAVTDLAEIFPTLVFPDSVGLMTLGRENLLPYATGVFNAFGPHNALFDAAVTAMAPAAIWVAEACKRKNLSPGGWGMAVHQQADAGACTEAEAERLVRSLLTAGLDTTINGIGNMLLAFASSPDEWARLRADPTLKRRAFEEALRWKSTVQTFFRTTSCDIEIAGATIPEGAKVLLFLAAANRDPRKWPDAERFDITRQAAGHVAFGLGIHQCLGQMVARLEAECLLDALLRRVARFRLVGPPVQRLNNTLHALASLPVEIEPL